jgi:hypothetical protein
MDLNTKIETTSYLPNQTSKLVELGFIYALKNPDTNEIFYIGATESAPKDRLQGHYNHFLEALEGKRKMTRKFEYFKKIWPKQAICECLKIVQNDYLYKIEQDFIKEYATKWDLTNQTIGGEGGDTFSLQSSINKSRISSLISSKTLGRPKPEGFAENLSKTRMGANNPAAGKSCYNIAIFDSSDKFIKIIHYPWEISAFFDSIFGEEKHKTHASLAGNITKGVRSNKNKTSRSRNYIFKDVSVCNKEIQDMIQSPNESLE